MSDVEYLKKTFQALDKNKDNYVSKSELQPFLLQSGYSQNEANELFDAVDTDRDGQISLNEFLVGFAVAVPK